MKLSTCKENDVVIFQEDSSNFKKLIGSKGIVTRVSDTWNKTIVHFEDGEKEEFNWDNDDPEVTKVGTGRLVTTIVIDKKTLKY